MKVNKYLPFALLYFFVNSLGLPFGLTYTAVFAPFFYLWILRVRKKDVLLPFTIILMPFIIIQVYEGVEINVYAISMINLFLVYIFGQAVYTFLIKCGDVEKIFQWILILNFILCVIACSVIFYSFLFMAMDGARE